MTGYTSVGTDGTYIYFTPYRLAAAYHGKVLRLDPKKPFNDTTSWEIFDGESLGGDSFNAVTRPVFDGRYMYFSPILLDTTALGRIARYDTTGDFTNPSSWSSFDPTTISPDAKGYQGAVFDGRYVYLSPAVSGGVYHGNFLRIDTASEEGYSLRGSRRSTGRSVGAAPGIEFQVATSDGVAVLGRSLEASSQWHMVAATLSKEDASLYLDGELVASKKISLANVPSFPQIAGDQAGDGFDGALDEIQIYSAPLDQAGIRRIYEEMKAGDCPE